MSAAANIAYAARAENGGKLTLPVLFLHGAYDYTCKTIDSRLAEPMRRDCTDLTEVVVPSGHWMAQERPIEVNAALAKMACYQSAGCLADLKYTLGGLKAASVREGPRR